MNRTNTVKIHEFYFSLVLFSWSFKVISLCNFPYNLVHPKTLLRKSGDRTDLVIRTWIIYKKRETPVLYQQKPAKQKQVGEVGFRMCQPDINILSRWQK